MKFKSTNILGGMCNLVKLVSPVFTYFTIYTDLFYTHSVISISSEILYYICTSLESSVIKFLIQYAAFVNGGSMCIYTSLHFGVVLL